MEETLERTTREAIKAADKARWERIPFDPTADPDAWLDANAARVAAFKAHIKYKLVTDIGSYRRYDVLFDGTKVGWVIKHNDRWGAWAANTNGLTGTPVKGDNKPTRIEATKALLDKIRWDGFDYE